MWTDRYFCISIIITTTIIITIKGAIQDFLQSPHCTTNFLQHICSSRGQNSSVGSAWARCPQCRGFDPPLGTLSGRGDFSLGVNMGSNSIPPKTPSDESINRGLVCAHMHFITWTQKILTFMIDGWMPATKTHPACTIHKTECDYLNGWIKKRVTYVKISPKSGEPQRYSWGTQLKKKKKKKLK